MIKQNTTIQTKATTQLLLPHLNNEKVSKYMKSPDKELRDKFDSEVFKKLLSKYFNVKRENLIIKHVCDELNEDFMKLRTLSDITNTTPKLFLELLVFCFVDVIDNKIKRILTRTYKKYVQNVKN